MSKANIEELKEKYTTIYKLEIPTDDGEKVLYLRKLDRITYKAGTKLMEKDELLAAETFLRALTVHGEVEEVISDFEALRVASALLIDVIGVRTGNVVVL